MDQELTSDSIRTSDNMSDTEMKRDIELYISIVPGTNVLLQTYWARMNDSNSIQTIQLSWTEEVIIGR